jgi:hypothetical protein
MNQPLPGDGIGWAKRSSLGRGNSLREGRRREVDRNNAELVMDERSVPRAALGALERKAVGNEMMI